MSSHATDLSVYAKSSSSSSSLGFLPFPLPLKLHFNPCLISLRSQRDVHMMSWHMASHKNNNNNKDGVVKVSNIRKPNRLQKASTKKLRTASLQRQSNKSRNVNLKKYFCSSAQIHIFLQALNDEHLNACLECFLGYTQHNNHKTAAWQPFFLQQPRRADNRNNGEKNLLNAHHQHWTFPGHPGWAGTRKRRIFILPKGKRNVSTNTRKQRGGFLDRHTPIMLDTSSNAENDTSSIIIFKKKKKNSIQYITGARAFFAIHCRSYCLSFLASKIISASATSLQVVSDLPLGLTLFTSNLHISLLIYCHPSVTHDHTIATCYVAILPQSSITTTITMKKRSERHKHWL